MCGEQYRHHCANRFELVRWLLNCATWQSRSLQCEFGHYLATNCVMLAARATVSHVSRGEHIKSIFFVFDENNFSSHSICHTVVCLSQFVCEPQHQRWQQQVFADLSSGCVSFSFASKSTATAQQKQRRRGRSRKHTHIMKRITFARRLCTWAQRRAMNADYRLKTKSSVMKNMRSVNQQSNRRIGAQGKSSALLPTDIDVNSVDTRKFGSSSLRTLK